MFLNTSFLILFLISVQVMANMKFMFMSLWLTYYFKSSSLAILPIHLRSCSIKGTLLTYAHACIYSDVYTLIYRPEDVISYCDQKYNKHSQVITTNIFKLNISLWKIYICIGYLLICLVFMKHGHQYINTSKLLLKCLMLKLHQYISTLGILFDCICLVILECII